MRKTWFAIWAAAGCAAGYAGAGAAVAQTPAAPFNQVGAPSKPTWTQRLMSPFGLRSSAEKKQAAAQEAARVDDALRLKHDPIALEFKSGPPSPQLYVAMAEMSYRGGAVEQARQLYQKAIKMDPKNLDALMAAAHMEDREGKLDVAQALYLQAAAAYPYNPAVFNDLGLCHARQGQFPAAERALIHAVQLEPAKPLYRNNLAKVQVELNRLEAAVANLAAVYQAPIVNYNMAVLLRERGRFIEAEQYLARSLSLDPQMHPARVLLADLRQPSEALAAQLEQFQQSPAFEVAQAPTTSAANDVQPQNRAQAELQSTAAQAQVLPVDVAGPTVQFIETEAQDFSALETLPVMLPPVE